MTDVLDLMHGNALDISNAGVGTERMATAVISFGGRGDFVANVNATGHSDTIQAAINAVSAVGGGNVGVRPGKYRLDKVITIPENVFLVGEKWARQGAGTTTGGATFKTAIGVTLDHMVEVVGNTNPASNADLKHDTGLRDITLDGNSTTTTGVLLTNEDTCTVDHCRLVLMTNGIKTVWDSNVDPTAATIPGGLRITNNNISSVGGIGIDMQYQTQSWITGNWFSGTSVAKWINIVGNTKITISGGNEFNTAAIGISINDTATFPTNDITIVGNRFAVGVSNKNLEYTCTNASSNRIAYSSNTIANGTSDFINCSDKVINNTDTRRQIILSNDFLVSTGTQAIDPFLATAVASGTTNQPTAGIVDANHPGSIRLLSSTTTNSGYFIGTNIAQIRLAGEEQFNAIFQLASLALNTTRLGFLDTATVADAVDGAYLEIDSSGVVTGKTANNSTRSSTGTTYTISATTWYRAFIRTNAAATAVTFYLYNDAGTLLWTDTLSTNIPTASGREVGAGFIITNSGTTAIDLAHLDYMSFAIRRSVQRGGV